MRHKALVLMVPLTHLRVGAGSSPTAIDLPLVRDNFGIPFIPASSFKGSLKAHVAIKNGCIIHNEGKAKLDCEKCRDLCCLLGSDETETELAGISKLSFSDLYPILVPYPHPTELYIYLTSTLILEKVRFAFASIIDNPVEEFSNSKSDVEIDGIRINLKKAKLSEDFLDLLRDINPLFDEYLDEVYVVDDKLWSLMVNKSTVKETKNRIDRNRGSVERGGLWNEEYMPYGTVIVGSAWLSEGENGYCSREFSSITEAFKALKLEPKFSLFLGGRESVGRGLVEVKVIE